MLVKNTPPTPSMTTAYRDDYTVRLAAGLCCPLCRTALRAVDVESHGRDMRLTCSACHGVALGVDTQ